MAFCCGKRYVTRRDTRGSAGMRVRLRTNALSQENICKGAVVPSPLTLFYKVVGMLIVVICGVNCIDSGWGSAID